MIDRILIAGILVGAALLLLFWKADDKFMNKVREGVGITGTKDVVVDTGFVEDKQNENSKF